MQLTLPPRNPGGGDVVAAKYVDLTTDTLCCALPSYGCLLMGCGTLEHVAMNCGSYHHVVLLSQLSRRRFRGNSYLVRNNCFADSVAPSMSTFITVNDHTN